ncbi:MAGI3 protein, partial [Atractosteus spatula]|nr:MAGI3 protein [Atractosteus spatula]
HTHTHTQRASTHTHTHTESQHTHTHTHREPAHTHTHTQRASTHTHTHTESQHTHTHTHREPAHTHTHTQRASTHTHTHTESQHTHTHTHREPAHTHTHTQRASTHTHTHTESQHTHTHTHREPAHTHTHTQRASTHTHTHTESQHTHTHTHREPAHTHTHTQRASTHTHLLTMSKAAVKKLHWRSKVQESFVPLGGASGELGVSIGGGADYGEFPFVTSVQGGGTNVGDVILEIGGTPVLGMTLGDVRGVLNSCPHPIRIKTVSPGQLCPELCGTTNEQHWRHRCARACGYQAEVARQRNREQSGSTLCKDLRLYLSKCFTPGSMDSQLQQVIRENLYLRAVPCEWTASCQGCTGQ